MIDKESIKCLIEDYRKAEETEEWDEFGEIYGDIDSVCDYLVDFIEQEIIK